MENKQALTVLVAGDGNYVEVYSNFFKQKGIEVVRYNGIHPGKRGKDIKLAVVFSRFGLYGVMDIIEEFHGQNISYPVLPVIPGKDFEVLDNMYKLDINTMSFDLEPEVLVKQVTDFAKQTKKIIPDHLKLTGKPDYTINFFEKKGTFFIDVGGSLDKEKLSGLRIMFKDYLKNKIEKLRGIVYIFNNVNEFSIQFQTVWSLFRIWKDIGIDFKKVFYLTASDIVASEIGEYTDHLGIHRDKNLLHIIAQLYPELEGRSEQEVFNFASELVQVTV